MKISVRTSKKVGLCSPNVAAVKGLPITEEITHREQIANHKIQNKKKTAERIYFISGIPWFGRDAENSQGNKMANEYFQVLKFKPRVKTIINTYMVTLLPPFKRPLIRFLPSFRHSFAWPLTAKPQHTAGNWGAYQKSEQGVQTSHF